MRHIPSKWGGLSMPPRDFFALAEQNEANLPILYMLQLKHWMDKNGNSRARLSFGIDGELFANRGKLYVIDGKYRHIKTCNELMYDTVLVFNRIKPQCDWLTAFMGDGVPAIIYYIRDAFQAKLKFDVEVSFHDLTIKPPPLRVRRRKRETR